MPHTEILEAGLAALVIIDVQEKMTAAIRDEREPGFLRQIRRLIEAARILEVPILLTEQYPKGLGRTVPEIVRSLPDGLRPLEKTACSCWRDEGFRAALQRTDREHVILAGLEAHVCIQQTALDLLRVDYVPFVAADAVASRRPYDRDTALERLRQAGVVVSTTESLIFELVERCDHPRFKEIVQIVK